MCGMCLCLKLNPICRPKTHEADAPGPDCRRRAGYRRVDRLEFATPCHGDSLGPGWGAGPSRDQFSIARFDFAGLDKKFNNVYADTKHYKKSTEPETYFGNWVDQTQTVIKQYPRINYIRVTAENGVVPDKFKNIANLLHWDKAKFLEAINN